MISIIASVLHFYLKKKLYFLKETPEAITMNLIEKSRILCSNLDG